MTRFTAAALCVGLALAGCAPATNTTGTPTNASEQVAAGLYGSYIAADSAYLAALTAGRVTKAQIAQIEPKRLAAKAALDQFAAASVNGNVAAQQVVVQTAIDALVAQLGNDGIKVGN